MRTIEQQNAVCYCLIKFYTGEEKTDLVRFIRYG
jgi:hypothetical protein